MNSIPSIPLQEKQIIHPVIFWRYSTSILSEGVGLAPSYGALRDIY